nr:protein AAR2 homolog [Quercus suber]POE50757.1 protein aar2 like [Quercus suber]
METANTPALLLIDLPQPALAGIDLLAFTTSRRFKGVKNLPPGLHFTYVGSSTTYSERHGLWFRVFASSQTHDQIQLVLTKWDAASEILAPDTDSTENLRWRANLGSIWHEGLTPYRQTATDSTSSEFEAEAVDWPSLTSHITDELLTRITGTSHWTLSSADSAKRDLEDIPGLAPSDTSLTRDRELHFLPVDLKQTWRAGATGRERTTAAQDRSWSLNALISRESETALLGELQFCFLMVLTVNNFSCLEQWRRLLTLLLTCESGITTRPAFFTAALTSLCHQLQHCRLADTELLDFADEGGTLLRTLLTRFRRALETLGDERTHDVEIALTELEEFLSAEHGWQFGGSFAKAGVLELEDGERVQVETTAWDAEDETGEYAPQIVELTPSQARLLGQEGEEGVVGLHQGRGVASLSSDDEEDEDEDDDDDDDEEEMQDLDELDSRY